jgi:L-ascorbate metabolism protein UlaG (beta-lactamase superfamily)
LKGDRIMISGKKCISIGIMVFLWACVIGAANASAADLPAIEKWVSNLHWLGHDSFRLDLRGGLVVYLDPFKIPDGPKADLIFITHDHFDHCSPVDVAKIQKPETLIVTVSQAAAKLSGQIQTIKPGETLTAKGVTVKAIPAYNVNKFRSPGVPFHPKESGYVGFMLSFDGKSLYLAGDTDFIPEMKGLQPDVALLPVSGTYVMTVDEAVEAAAAIKPRLAIPMHVGGPIGALSQADEFKRKATVPVTVLPLEK